MLMQTDGQTCRQRGVLHARENAKGINVQQID
jgi:hypothetical protein